MFALCGPPQSLEPICGIPLQKYVARWGIVFALCGPPQSFTGHTRSVHMPPLGNPLAATVNVQELLFDLPAIMAPHRHFAGNRPSALISWDRTTPFALGRLLALYEHITIVSGFIWGVNSFDQWGVEIGKSIASDIANGRNLSGLSPAGIAFLKKLDE